MMEQPCEHAEIDASIEIAFACSTIRFTPEMRYPVDPPNAPLRKISISDLRCVACRKALTRQDVGARFDPGGDLHHPRFLVQYAIAPNLPPPLSDSDIERTVESIRDRPKRR